MAKAIPQPYVPTIRLNGNVTDIDTHEGQINIHGACQVILEVYQGELLINGYFITKTTTDGTNIFNGVRILELGFPYLLTGNIQIGRTINYPIASGPVKFNYEIVYPNTLV